MTGYFLRLPDRETLDKNTGEVLSSEPHFFVSRRTHPQVPVHVFPTAEEAEQAYRDECVLAGISHSPYAVIKVKFEWEPA